MSKRSIDETQSGRIKPGMVAYTYNLSCLEGRGRVEGQPGQSYGDPHVKNKI
jgi:hypothetical protein